MPIEFEAPKPIVQAQYMLKTVGEEMMRSKSRYFDENEHEIPWDYIEFMHTAMKSLGVGSLAPKKRGTATTATRRKKSGRRLPIRYWLRRSRRLPGATLAFTSSRREADLAQRLSRRQARPSRNPSSWHVFSKRNRPLPPCA